MSHIFGTLEGVQYIKTVEDIVPKMERVIAELKLTEVSRCFHQFEPFGATGVILLAESHFSVHTYPENNKLYFDLFCCQKDFKANSAKAAGEIYNSFNASKITWECKDRM
jgi:S-adenosylmethionine decarboxylase